MGQADLGQEAPLGVFLQLPSGLGQVCVQLQEGTTSTGHPARETCRQQDRCGLQQDRRGLQQERRELQLASAVRAYPGCRLACAPIHSRPSGAPDASSPG